MLRRDAPAKLNLYLRVLGPRPDGYHEIETLFERIDLADELTAEPADTLTLTCDDASLPCGPENLVLQAAEALRTASGTARGARLHLRKRIPVAAGLGGGSSDAAAALALLNDLWALGWGGERLAGVAAQVGSDVPFFLSPGPFAVGRGRGERCEPVAGSRPLAHVLVVPEARLSTADVYRGARFDLTSPKPSLSMVLHALRNGSLSELATGLWNDLQPEAIRRCPHCPVIQSSLRACGCLGTLVSGSGSAVFGLCRDRAHAQDIAARLRAQGQPAWRVEVVQTHAGG
jgi:4-diphosphocytidyl-2-C-methyl-D-erythritol kinase